MFSLCQRAVVNHRDFIITKLRGFQTHSHCMYIVLKIILHLKQMLKIFLAFHFLFFFRILCTFLFFIYKCFNHLQVGSDYFRERGEAFFKKFPKYQKKVKKLCKQIADTCPIAGYINTLNDFCGKWKECNFTFVE